jgi:hypothetical protein
LQKTRLGLEGLRALCESDNFQDLTLLSLAGNGLVDSAVELLCRSKAFPSLITLDLYHNRISDQAVDQLHSAPNLKSVRAFQVDWRG